MAVGTTVVRALESAALACLGQGDSIFRGEGARPDSDVPIAPMEGWTRLLIVPPFRFRITDALVTNFHLPRSTLLCLVSALAGRESVLAAYREAVAQRYRFYSYGDAMLVGKAVG